MNLFTFFGICFIIILFGLVLQYFNRKGSLPTGTPRIRTMTTHYFQRVGGRWVPISREVHDDIQQNPGSRVVSKISLWDDFDGDIEQELESTWLRILSSTASPRVDTPKEFLTHVPISMINPATDYVGGDILNHAAIRKRGGGGGGPVKNPIPMLPTDCRGTCLNRFQWCMKGRPEESGMCAGYYENCLSACNLNGHSVV